MADITYLTMPRRIPIWFQMDTVCDHCGKPALKWVPGLCTRDREAGMDTGDFITCPECVTLIHFEPTNPTSTVAKLRDYPNAFAYIHWFWSI